LSSFRPIQAERKAKSIADRLLTAMSTATVAKSEARGGKACTFSTWKKQLITHEDPGHVHKTLGILCLLSYIWRLSQSGATDMGFATRPALTLPTIIMHWCLTLSAFIFKIPAKRIKSGDRIWPEYRLHALVFLSRSLAIMCVYYYEEYYQLEPNYDLNFVIVMAALLAADISSWSVGDNRSPSIRELDTHPAVKFYFSVMQFGATAGCLYGLRRYSLMFYMAFIVQLNPFLMTLRRKNLLSKSVVVTLYGVGLASAIALVIYEYTTHTASGFNSFLCQGLIINLAAWLRLGPRLPLIRYVQDNKYLMWLLLGLLMRQIRPIFDEPLSRNMNLLCQGLRISMFMLGIWKGWLRDYMQKGKVNKLA
jgi:hypothetical protein